MEVEAPEILEVQAEEIYPEILKNETEKPTKNRSEPVIGSMRQVWNGTADMTSGRLRKEDLMKNRRGKIISIRKHFQAMRLVEEGKLKPFSK